MNQNINKNKEKSISSIKIFLLRIRSFFWLVLSRIKYGTVVFLDTNILVASEKDKFDKRVKKLHYFFNEYYITDVTENERNELLSTKHKSTFKYKYKIISFKGLREELPSLCPTYYNLIGWMYNPANIASPDFHLHMIQSLKLRGRTLNKEQHRLYNILMDRLKKASVDNFKSSGDKKTLLDRHLDMSAFQYFRKKIKNQKSKNLLNDYKNLATILLFSLLKKKNTVFVTADRDLFAIVLTLCESLAQGVTFPYLFLATLTDINKRDILSGKSITKFLDFTEFKKFYKGVLEDIIDFYWQKDHVSLRIRLWDTEKKCFVEDMALKFNKDTQDLILNMHGPLNCPFSKNDTQANWIHYLYWPPSLNSPNVVKVKLTVKKGLSRKNINVPNHIHKANCKYAIDDSNDNLKNYFGFWL